MTVYIYHQLKLVSLFKSQNHLKNMKRIQFGDKEKLIKIEGKTICSFFLFFLEAWSSQKEKVANIPIK